MDTEAVVRVFGQVLRRVRRDALMTQEQLGLEADLQRNFISELELGRKQPSVVTLFKLTRALGVSPEKFVSLMSKELKQ